ncbi:apolipoprotein N-acyltransferase [Mycobacterium sp. SM1]|uniref:apolipoprotein N-acyltransferase n=1 Tax=Mycobacterium sp. SM1 TaxID=2816243 RepID=UPI001BCA76D6|nr:apolipoprotein N-acyltransferase [Mycobacterium sp. SM1]MBS4730474.1 apolipoprotein N-acyltransferase [Mycobacterium sp. SM1]
MGNDPRRDDAKPLFGRADANRPAAAADDPDVNTAAAADADPDTGLDPSGDAPPHVPAASRRAWRPGSPVPRRLRKRSGTARTRLARLGAAAPRWLARALLPRLPRLGATIVAGLLLCASFPPLKLWWSAILAVALLAWVLTRQATTTLGGLGYSFLFGLAFYLPLLPWISTLVGAIPWLTLSIVCAAFPGLFGLLAVVVRCLPGWPIWFALLWGSQEWLKSAVPFGGFPWGEVAAGQTDGPFLPLVRLGGVALLSVAIVLLGCSIAALALETHRWWQAGRQARGGGRGPHGSRTDTQAVDMPPAVVLPAFCICLTLLTAVVVWPPVRHSGAGSGDDPPVTVAAVQGNVPKLGLDFNAQRLAVLRNHVQETLRLAEDVRAGRAPQPQFVVWPEDASEIDPLLNRDAAQQISAAVDAIRAPILVGALFEVPGMRPDHPAYTNTVIVWNPGTGPADRHDKRIIQPFGEYLPWRGFFRRLTPLADLANYIVPGKSVGVVRAAGIPVGVATCWEVIFDRALRESVRNGAQLFAMPSNNATFNKAMSEQHLAFDKLRAVEHDRYAVVAGTVGISAVIAPDGREVERTDFFVPAYLDTQVRLRTTLTPAGRWAPILQWLVLTAGVAAVLAAIRHNGWFPRPNRRHEPSAVASRAPSGDAEGATPPDEGITDIPPGGDRQAAGRYRGAP